MPPPSIDKMLETMMMQILSPDHNAAKVVCCRCLGVKKKKQRSSRTSCKSKNDLSKNHKKRHRKKKKSCLKTIICLSKMAKDRGERQSCSCDPCCRNMMMQMDGDGDERFCSKCGQTLPGIEPVDQPLNQPDQCLKQIELRPQERKEMGVQVNVEHKEPVAVRIKVCPCPNKNQRRQEGKLHHSISEPELSRTTPTLVDDATSDNLVSSRVPQTRLEDDHYDASRQSRLPLMDRLNETATEWPVDIASIKKLVLNMAKARLVEEAACWERERAHHYLQQSQLQGGSGGLEQPAEEPSEDTVYGGRNAKTVGGSQPHRRANLSLEAEQGATAQRPTCYGTSISLPTNQTPAYTNYSHHNQNSDGLNENHDMTNLSVLYNLAGCCAGTNVYCYSPESGPSPLGAHCEHACTCGNPAQLQSYQQFPGPYFGYPHHSANEQQNFIECEEPDRSRRDACMSYRSIRPRSPCQ